MNTDKAYLLGLIIGGGIFGNAEDVFRIRLPFKKWGSYIENPERAGDISGDILRKVGQMFRAIYNLSIQYETTKGGTWVILCDGDSSLVKADLAYYGILCEGEIRKTADIAKLVQDLVDDNLKRRFIAGLADTIGSMAPSHRRFTNEHQTMSFEISGYNFQFVCELCRLLYSINCYPDQILWNHPNFHCPNDPYFTQWSKGFKLRVLLDQYAQFGAFAFRAKAKASNENRKLQAQRHAAGICEDSEVHITPSTVHPAENDKKLPEYIRGGHYIHFRHICAVIGCEHAPYCKIDEYLSKLGEVIIPFPILSKDTVLTIEERIRSDVLLANRRYCKSKTSVGTLISIYENDHSSLLFGTSGNNGYPIVEILQAVAYIIADERELFGKRPRGAYLSVIKNKLAANPSIYVEVQRPDLLTPLILMGNGKGAMVAAKNPDVYSKLISFAPDNKYKVYVRKITEEDLRNA